MDNKTILQKANAEVTKGNNEGFLEYCSDEIEWEFVGEQTLRGKAAVLDYMNSTYVTPPEFNVEREIAEGNFVTVLGKISLPGENAEQVDYEYCDVWKFHDAKLIKLKAFVIKTKP